MFRYYSKEELYELNRIPILDVANLLGLSVKNNKTLCFMHNDRNPSLSFNVVENYYNCFVCKTGGSVIRLVMEIYNLKFLDACKWLIGNFGIEFHKENSDRSFDKANTIKPVPVISNLDNRINIKPDIDVYNWIYNVVVLSPNAENYLMQRGFNRKTITYFKSIIDVKHFFEKCLNRWGIERMINCGLMCGDNYQHFIWGTKSVLIIPFRDLSNKIIYIQARCLEKSKMKYINLKGVELPLFNMQILRNMRNDEDLYICEGIMDAVAATQCNKNAIGVIGSNGFKETFVKMLLNFKITVIPDNDPAGDYFYESIKFSFEKYDKKVKVMRISKEYKDLNEALLRKK